MKSFLRKWGIGNATHDDFNLGGTVVVIFLLLLFMGTSVYLMITNY